MLECFVGHDRAHCFKIGARMYAYIVQPCGGLRTNVFQAFDMHGGETRPDELPAIKPGNAHRLMDVATKPPVIKQNTQVRLQSISF